MPFAPTTCKHVHYGLVWPQTSSINLRSLSGCAIGEWLGHRVGTLHHDPLTHERHYRYPMLRRLIITILVFASLTSQASIGFVCAMITGAPVVRQHCCCEHDVARPGCDPSDRGKGCCRAVVEFSGGPSDQISGTAAETTLPNYDPQSLPQVLLPALLALTLPVYSLEPAWDEAGDHGSVGTDLYLHTHRLRL